MRPSPSGLTARGVDRAGGPPATGREGGAARGANVTPVAAVRITSGPLRGVELETGVRGHAGRLRLFWRSLRRRRQTPPLRPIR